MKIYFCTDDGEVLETISSTSIGTDNAIVERMGDNPNKEATMIWHIISDDVETVLRILKSRSKST